jgi:tetratricopeptide (TPR) repeat protein
LQYQLGTTYLKTGQNDKAVSHLREAVEQNDAEPMMLNNVAYALAENKIGLDLARQYGEKALKILEERSIEDVNAPESGARVTYQLSLLWDTLGWAYFQSGDASRSESFVRAAWLLGQEPVVGEHLGEIYEKEGNNKAAAQAYELALAAVEGSPAVIPPRSFGSPVAPAVDLSGREALRKEIAARYRKLTGKKPATRESWRLPSGAWTKSAAEQLNEMRTVNLGKVANLSGSAEFTIVFASGKVESVRYVSGEDAVKALIEKIKAGHFQVEFPLGSQAKILRRALVGCYPISGCMATLIPVNVASR